MLAFPISKILGHTGKVETPHSRAAFRTLSAMALMAFAPMMLGAIALTAPTRAIAQISISTTIAPPPLPVYEQPPIPDDGYIWTPGYWDYDDEDGYFWVPGTWIQPPYQGALWTPGYWGYGDDGAYIFHTGYWAAEIGFYGGINYGFGYGGRGYDGGRWDGGHFAYNRTVNNISNVHITNVYNRTVYNNVTVNRTSFNGGNGGTAARPTQQQLAAGQAHRVDPTSVQMQQRQTARANKAQFATVNKGVPAVAATPRPGAFSGGGVTHANARFAPPPSAIARLPQHSAAAHPPASAAMRPGAEAHPQAERAPQAVHTAAPTHVAPAHVAPAYTENRAPAPRSQAVPMARPEPPRPAAAPRPPAPPHAAPPPRPAAPRPAPHPQNGEKPRDEQPHP